MAAIPVKLYRDTGAFKLAAAELGALKEQQPHQLGPPVTPQAKGSSGAPPPPWTASARTPGGRRVPPSMTGPMSPAARLKRMEKRMEDGEAAMEKEKGEEEDVAVSGGAERAGGKGSPIGVDAFDDGDDDVEAQKAAGEKAAGAPAAAALEDEGDMCAICIGEFEPDEEVNAGPSFPPPSPSLFPSSASSPSFFLLASGPCAGPVHSLAPPLPLSPLRGVGR